MFNFTAGMFCGVAWQPANGAAAVLNIRDHDLSLMVLLIDTTNSGDGGLRSRIAGPFDVEGLVHASLDADFPPWLATPFVVPGAVGVCAFGVSGTRNLQVPVQIEKLHLTSVVDNQEVRYDFTVKANRRAGLVVYPAL